MIREQTQFALESLVFPSLAPCAMHAPVFDAAELGSSVGLLGHGGLQRSGNRAAGGKNLKQ